MRVEDIKDRQVIAEAVGIINDFNFALRRAKQLRDKLKERFEKDPKFYDIDIEKLVSELDKIEEVRIYL
jgi:hypothetical protein